MKRDGHNNVRFFVGGEVEHTPAFSKKTLFVVGKQDVTEIEKLAREHHTTHVFMGANHSFTIDPTDSTFYWRDTITKLLDMGFMVTLDYEAHLHEKVLLMFTAGVWQSRLFVPLLSVRIPNVATSNPNLTVKIDDVDFKATNPGVWCMHFHEVTDSNRFTDWQDYETDVVIGDVVVTPVVAARKSGVLEQPAVVPELIVKNDTDLGLDITPATALKFDDTNISALGVVTTVAEAAEAYATGATTDPVATETKKVKAKK